VSAALIEIPILLVLGAGGIALFFFFGVRNPLVLAGSAILGTSAVSLVGFPFALLFGASPFWIVLMLSAVMALAVIVVGRVSPQLWQGLGLFAVLVALAWFLRFVVQVRERSGEDAISVLLQAVLDIQQGQPPSDLRRSYSYPLLIALAPEGTILASVTPLVTLSVLAVTVGFAIELLPRNRNGARFWAIFLGVALVASAPIVWIALVYTNSHLLMALAIAIATGGVLVSTQSLSLPRSTVALHAIAGVVGSTTRFEGAFMMLVVLAPLLLGTVDYLASKRALVLALSFAPTLGLTQWILLSQTPLPVSAFVLFTVLIGAPLLILGVGKVLGAKAEGWLVAGGWIALLLLVVGLAVMIYGVPGAQRLAIANVWNFILGVSGWGAVIPATLVGTFIIFRGLGNRLYRIATRTWTWGIFLTIAVKLADSPPGNQGFNNTLSRTFLHWLGPLILVWILGLYSTLSGRARSQRNPVGKAVSPPNAERA
jgi:hypothetical protein